MRFFFRRVGIMDTSVATQNTGDIIIMEAARKILESLLIEYQMIFFTTHEKLSMYSYKLQRSVDFNIACGTNLLHSHMGLIKQWNIGVKDTFFIKPVILFGVGWRSDPKRRTDPYTKWLLRNVLSPKGFHSVRDSYAERQLKKIGIRNVINTGCPTTWFLTEEHCAEIPSEKGENAVVVLTDYSRNEERDQALLDIVLTHYKKVFFWCQGTSDYSYIKSLPHYSKLEIIPPSLTGYTRLLSDRSVSLDYVGTRLHGGIYALRHKRRSVIIGVDHRAIEMGRDLNLPVIDRYAPDSELENKVISPFHVKITLPKENIEKWKRQFEY